MIRLQARPKLSRPSVRQRNCEQDKRSECRLESVFGEKVRKVFSENIHGAKKQSALFGEC
jgi:hypothetical protein